MSMYELPMTDTPSQEFMCEIGGTNYLFRIQLNVRGDLWTMDVSSSDDEPILQGVSLTLGVDLLSNERFTDGLVFLVDYTGKNQGPTGDNLADYGLIWSDEEDLVSDKTLVQMRYVDFAVEVLSA